MLCAVGELEEAEHSDGEEDADSPTVGRRRSTLSEVKADDIHRAAAKVRVFAALFSASFAEYCSIGFTVGIFAWAYGALLAPLPFCYQEWRNIKHYTTAPLRA